MSGYLIAEVQCDGCLDHPREVAEDEGTLREHRQYVREHRGWSRRRVTQGLLDALPELTDGGVTHKVGDLIDLCPDCTEELKADTP